MAKEVNQLTSFYREHVGLIRLLSPEQAGRLLFAMLDLVFDGKETDLSDDQLLNGIFDATKASALRQAKKYNEDKRRSESMHGKQNALKDKPNEPNIPVNKE